MRVAGLLLAGLATIAAASDNPPAWEAAKVTPAARDVVASSYVVKDGDTLGLIVARTGAGADAIAQANALEPPFRLRLGQRLKIPAGRYHRVAKGQSGIAIARAYSVEWHRIAELNHLEPPYQLREGQRLLLPSAKEAAKMTLEERAAAFHIDIDDLVTGGEPALAPKAEKAKPAAPTRKAAEAIAPTTPVAPPPPEAAPGRFGWPVEGRILRTFGPQANGGRNDGIDIAAAAGTPFVATADGVVAYAGSLAGFGQLVLIRHGGNYLSAYGHAQSLNVARGQAVRRGQTLGKVGATGSAPEPELHFELRAGRKPVDPRTMLPASAKSAARSE
ncbi:M23 family metallopeptidase [Sphingomonas nostoxanthinifaciens]|uniref:M23 family metallopeptidase n=1 Tax=Sphingomonas nostoxanthinifaciens TaxID=2872652 RepID=UPI001CC1D52B|nr:M23 family metallopeptidase [Sphingomonas nostoxanthinifaciens]UAK22940.1 LysM peptidoglycan-binding domain-containing M23 family metallopeptidase [Sphingomonas nostoxanthinifaciens]